jgi:dTMP kinase
MFITLEGPEGSGKTTHSPLLAEYFRRRGYRVMTTREPGGTPISEQVRAVLTHMDNQGMHPRTEILLFLSARAQLVEEVIRPRLKMGEIVLSDRYADSTLAYQGYGHGVDLDILRRLLDFATGGLTPDLTILLDIDAEAGLRRKVALSTEWNRLDAYTLDFHRRVCEGYRQLARNEPQRWVVINADRSLEEVQADLRKIILERLTSSQSPKIP